MSSSPSNIFYWTNVWGLNIQVPGANYVPGYTEAHFECSVVVHMPVHLHCTAGSQMVHKCERWESISCIQKCVYLYPNYICRQIKDITVRNICLLKDGKGYYLKIIHKLNINGFLSSIYVRKQCLLALRVLTVPSLLHFLKCCGRQNSVLWITSCFSHNVCVLCFSGELNAVRMISWRLVSSAKMFTTNSSFLVPIRSILGQKSFCLLSLWALLTYKKVHVLWIFM